jgi:hypothetical protein
MGNIFGDFGKECHSADPLLFWLALESGADGAGPELSCGPGARPDGTRSWPSRPPGKTPGMDFVRRVFLYTPTLFYLQCASYWM